MLRQTAFRINGRVVHPATGSIDAPSGRLRLEPRVMDLLVYLAQNAPQVISRDQIIKDVWRGTQVTDDVITRSISQIRRVLTEDWRKTPVLETIPKRGYRLIAAVEPASEETEEPVAQRAEADSALSTPASPPAELLTPEEPKAPRRRALLSWRNALIAGVLLLFAVGVEVMVQPTVSNSAPGGSMAALKSAVMIAPFAESGSARNDFLSGELSHELIDSLAASSDLRVIGADSTGAVLRTGKSALEGARELNVGVLITGSMQQSPEHLTVAVNMLDVNSGRILHSHDYQFAADEAASVAPAIARDLAATLGHHVALPPVATEKPTSSPEAYRLFMEARYYLAKNEPGSLDQGIDFLREAIKHDDSFAEAHAALSIALMLKIDLNNARLDQVLPEAQREIDKAFELNPNLAQAYGGRGLIDMYLRHPEEASTALRQAIALRPNYAQAHMWLGMVAFTEWQMRKTVASYRRATEIEPLSVMATMNLGMALDFSGLYEESEQELKRALVLQPQFANLHWALGHLLWDRGDLSAAQTEYRTAIDHGSSFSTLYGQMALLQLDAGTPERAPEWVSRGESLNIEDETLWLARLAVNVAQHRSLEPKGDAELREADLAESAFYRGDFKGASQHFRSAHKAVAVPRLLESRWLTLAGHAPALDEAAAAMLAGEDPSHTLLHEFARQLNELHAAGMQSPGIDYQQAAIAALQGDKPLAAQWLKSAHEHGWRQDWYQALDPKMRLLAGGG